MRNERKQQVKSDSGVPYENRTLSPRLIKIAHELSEIIASYVLSDRIVSLRSQKQTNAKARIKTQGMGAKFVRPGGKR